MARKGKEPAGLRRYRLAQKRKKKTRRVRAAPKRRKSMARRSGKRKRGGKSKSIPVAVVAPFAIVAVKDFMQPAPEGLYGKANRLLEDVTGYNVITGGYDYTQAMPLWMGTVAGVIVHKVANRTGINRHLKKLTFGYLTL